MLETLETGVGCRVSGAFERIATPSAKCARATSHS